jgi:hypothetical protein
MDMMGHGGLTGAVDRNKSRLGEREGKERYLSLENRACLKRRDRESSVYIFCKTDIQTRGKRWEKIHRPLEFRD